MYGTFLGGAAAVLTLCLFQASGVLVAAALLPREGAGVRLLAGSVLGSVEMQWFPALAAFLFGFDLRAQAAAVLLALACGAGALALCRRRGSGELAGIKNIYKSLARQRLLWLAAALWVFFCLLVWRSFSWREGRVYSSQATFGDMSMHLSFITSLARQGTFPPHYSLLPRARLSYPFLSDSISSSLYLLGAPLRLAYCLPMWVAGAQVFFGAWALLRALLGRQRRCAVAWTLFFFNGGLGLIYFFQEGGLNRILHSFYQTPTNLVEENIRWVNVVVDMLLPQRATLFGWAVLFTALYLLYRAVFEGQREYYLAVGVLAGALPMIHTHSFLALALVCGAWLTGALCQELGLGDRAARLGKLLVPLGLVAMSLLQAIPRVRNGQNGLLAFLCGAVGLWGLCLVGLAVLCCRGGRGRALLGSWGVLLGVTCVLALPQLFTWTFQQVSGGSMLRGHFGWVVGEDQYLWFYLKNLGLAAVLALVGLLAANKETFWRYCPALAIWFVAEFVEFQPNDYDNNKLLYVGFLFLCCAAADGLCALLRLAGLLPKEEPPAQAPAPACPAGRKRGKTRPKKEALPKPRPNPKRRLAQCLCAALVGVMSLPALLTMAREWVATYELFGEGALALCQYIEAELPPDAVVLTDQRHNNEVVSLTGRNIVCGSSSYLFYHGLNYAPSAQAAREMYQDPQGSQALFEEYGVDYILVSDFERNSFTVDQAGLDQLFPRVYDDGLRVLYSTQEVKP